MSDHSCARFERSMLLNTNAAAVSMGSCPAFPRERSWLKKAHMSSEVT